MRRIDPLLILIARVIYVCLLAACLVPVGIWLSRHCVGPVCEGTRLTITPEGLLYVVPRGTTEVIIAVDNDMCTTCFAEVYLCGEGWVSQECALLKYLRKSCDLEYFMPHPSHAIRFVDMDPWMGHAMFLRPWGGVPYLNVAISATRYEYWPR